jgi:hypothetical protein
MVKLQIPQHMQGEDWARMPKPKERFFGMSRTTLLELSQAGLIKTVSIRKPGANKGIRLIFVPSLREFLDKCAQEVNPLRNEPRLTARKR